MDTNDHGAAPAATGEGIVIEDQDVGELHLPEPKEGETIDWQAKAKEFQGIATRRGTKLAKFKDATKPAAPATPAAPAAPAPKPAELDYGQRAFLVASGLKAPDEEALVKDWMKDTGKPLEAILSNKRFQAELGELREARTTHEAIPGQSPRSDAPSRNSVDYWLTRPFSEVPADMKMKVIEARKNKEGGNRPDF